MNNYGSLPHQGALGLYGQGMDSWLIEENIFYQNGWYAPLIPQGSVTISSDGSSAVVTWPSAGLPPRGRPPDGSTVRFETTGVLPEPLVADTDYFVRNGSGSTSNLSFTPTGALIATSAPQSGTHRGYWVDPMPTIREHNVYIDFDSSSGLAGNLTGPTIVRNNITAYAASQGIQNRPGGITFNNLFIRNPIALNGAMWPSTISYNVILEGYDMQTTPPTRYGWGIDIVNFKCQSPMPPKYNCSPSQALPPGAGGTVVTKNIIAHSFAGGTNGHGIRLFPAGQTFSFHYPATTGITVSDNIICEWQSPIQDRGNGNAVMNNVEQAEGCDGLGFSAAHRTVGNYYVSIGGTTATTDAFLEAAIKKWNKDDWDPRYLAGAVNSYIRAGFDMADPQ
jgi:hypothetical protein